METGRSSLPVLGIPNKHMEGQATQRENNCVFFVCFFFSKVIEKIPDLQFLLVDAGISYLVMAGAGLQLIRLEKKADDKQKRSKIHPK